MKKNNLKKKMNNCLKNYKQWNNQYNSYNNFKQITKIFTKSINKYFKI